MNTAFDDATVIARFKLLLDGVFTHIPNLQLLSLQIGNEVDGVWAVSFLSLTDSSAAAVDGFGAQYGVCPGTECNNFKDFLGNLGLRSWAGDGVDKPSFTELRQQALARGWPVQ